MRLRIQEPLPSADCATFPTIECDNVEERICAKGKRQGILRSKSES